MVAVAQFSRASRRDIGRYGDATGDQLGTRPVFFQIRDLLSDNSSALEAGSHVRHGGYVDIMSRWGEQCPGENEHDRIQHLSGHSKATTIAIGSTTSRLMYAH